MAGGRLNLFALGVATAILLGEIVLVACPEGASKLFTHALVSAADQVEHFEAEGTIVRLDPAKHLMTIDHGDIKGLMSPMTMAFPTQSPELFTGIAPGDRVWFTLERSPQGLAIATLTKQNAAGAAQVILDVEGMT
jgi:Cu/Ag efflux protein CusF